MLTGIAWVANQLGYFLYGLNTTIIDADMLFNGTFNQPEFSIPEENRVDIKLPSGFVTGTCWSPGRGYNSTMLDFQFFSLTAHATVKYELSGLL